MFRKKQHTVALKFNVTEQNAGENKELSLKKQIQTEKHVVGPNAGI